GGDRRHRHRETGVADLVPDFEGPGSQTVHDGALIRPEDSPVLGPGPRCRRWWGRWRRGRGRWRRRRRWGRRWRRDGTTLPGPDAAVVDVATLGHLHEAIVRFDPQHQRGRPGPPEART